MMAWDVTGLGSVFDFAGKIVDRLFPDPTQKAAAQLEVLKMQQTGELAQLAADTSIATAQSATNTEEAKNSNLFVSGWRPAVGWVCALSLAYVGVLEPVGRFAATVGYHYVGTFPVIDTSVTFQLLFGMLGLGGMRTFEKIKGVASGDKSH